MGRVARRGCGRRDRRAESEAQLRHCLRFKGRVDPYAKHPTFETDISLSQLDMRQLNPFLRAYAHLDVERGTFSVDAEFAAKKGKFEGYVKPFMVKLDVLQGEK